MTRAEVIRKAIEKRITWQQAASICRITPRHILRLRRRYEQLEVEGLRDRRTGKRQPSRIPPKTVDKLCRLKKEMYADFSVKHFHQFATEKHGLKISYTWARIVLQSKGLVAKAAGRGKYRRKRERRPMVGHAGPPGRIDSRVDRGPPDGRPGDHAGRRGRPDSAGTIRGAGRDDVELAGPAPCAPTVRPLLRVLHGPWLRTTAGRPRPMRDRRRSRTGRSPVCSRRSESDTSWRDRPRRGDEASEPSERSRADCRRNSGWPASRATRQPTTTSRSPSPPDFNRRFAVVPSETESAFVPLVGLDLDLLVSMHNDRVVQKDNTVVFERLFLQLPPGKDRRRYVRCPVIVHELVNDTLAISYQGKLLARFDRQGTLLQTPSQSCLTTNPDRTSTTAYALDIYECSRHIGVARERRRVSRLIRLETSRRSGQRARGRR